MIHISLCYSRYCRLHQLHKIWQILSAVPTRRIWGSMLLKCIVVIVACNHCKQVPFQCSCSRWCYRWCAANAQVALDNTQAMNHVLVIYMWYNITVTFLDAVPFYNVFMKYENWPPTHTTFSNVPNDKLWINLVWPNIKQRLWVASFHNAVYIHVM